MRGKGGLAFDEDDFYDDGYDDDAYDDYDAPVATKAAGGRAAAGGKPPPSKQAPAAAAGASRLAQHLTDPPPLRPNGKLQAGAKKAAVDGPKAPAAAPPPLLPTAPAAFASKPGSSQPSPAATLAAADQNREFVRPLFKFDTPSPDEVVLAAQAGQAGQGAGSSSASKAAPTGIPVLPQSRTLLQPSKVPQWQLRQQQEQLQEKQRQQAAAPAATSTAARGAEAASAVGLTAGMSAMGVSAVSNGGVGRVAGATGLSGGGGSSAAVEAMAARPRVLQYVADADITRECELAAESERKGANSDKPGLHLVVLGHVDAGKSTLMGRMLYELGHVSQKEVHRNQKESAAAGKASFSWAWLLDERPEERARGVTVDVAMTRFTTPRFAITLLDAPGHRDFVPNMIVGAGQADAALLLVDGSIGGFEAGFEGSGGELSGGQTKEHAQLARSLGVEQMAVVISKLDTVDFSQERYQHIRSVLLPFLRTCGFKESSLQWLPAVGPTGENLTVPPISPQLSCWYHGPTLLQAIDAFSPRVRLTSRPLRMPVSDVFKSKAGSLVVGGKLECGALRVGSKLLSMPGAAAGAVRAIEVGGVTVSLSRAGDSVEVTLAQGGDIEAVALYPGAVLCTSECPCPVVRRFELRALVLEGASIPLLQGASVTLHAHAAREEATITGLVSLLDPKNGEVVRRRPRAVCKGQTAVLEVTARRGLCLEEYGDCKALGRVTLRGGGRTLAVGVVTRVIE